jgi:RNA polymerase sigma factor (sigma-70 family)
MPQHNGETDSFRLPMASPLSAQEMVMPGADGTIEQPVLVDVEEEPESLLPILVKKKEEPLTPAQCELVMSVHRWVKKKATEWAKMLAGHKTGYQRSIADDLYASAMYQVTRAARSYDPSTGYRFTSYIAMYILRGLQNATRDGTPIGPSFATGDGLRKVRGEEDVKRDWRERDDVMQAQRSIPINGLDEDMDAKITEKLAGKEDTLFEAERSDFWEAVDEVLSYQQAVAIRMRFMDDADDAQIARAIRVPVKKVKRIIVCGLERLRVSNMVEEIKEELRERDSKKEKREKYGSKRSWLK